MPDRREEDQGASRSTEPRVRPDGLPASETQHSAGWKSASCEGERCFCGRPAERKVEECIFWDDPTGWTEFAGQRAAARHPLTRYVCFDHFVQMMGPLAVQLDEQAKERS